MPLQSVSNNISCLTVPTLLLVEVCGRLRLLSLQLLILSPLLALCAAIIFQLKRKVYRSVRANINSNPLQPVLFCNLQAL